jgi:hypothetical protein
MASDNRSMAPLKTDFAEVESALFGALPHQQIGVKLIPK